MSPYPYTGVTGSLGGLESRDDNMWFGRPQGDFNRSRAAFNRTQFAAQQMFFNDLKFSAAKSIRTSTIILAVFNAIAALATALGILIDSYFRKKRNDKNFRFWRHGFIFIPEAEVYPLILSFGILIQSVIFASVQSTGLDDFFGTGCTWIAQIMLPAVFIAPYTHLVLGVEVAIRGLKKKPFAPRGKFNVSICLSLIGMLTLANFLVADFDQTPNFCFSSLFWFVKHYAVLCFGLLVAIATINLSAAVAIFIRLHRSLKVEVTARVAASRMVYYLALAGISNSFMIPFFFVQGFANERGQRNNAMTLGMVAAVVANVSGLMNGGLYLFLKSSATSTIGPTDKAGEYENRRARHKMTHHEPNDSGDDDDSFSNTTLNSTTAPRGLRRVDSEASLITARKGEDDGVDNRSISASLRGGEQSRDSFRSHRLVSAVASVLMPKAPEPARAPPATHARKRSYSLFPRAVMGPKSSLLLPSTTYSPADALKPPPSMANLAKLRHRRDSSLVSSATVQIGLRLSSVEAIPPQTKTKLEADDGVVHTIDCPNLDRADTQSPGRSGIVGPGTPTVTTRAGDRAKYPIQSTPTPAPPTPRAVPVVPKINSQVSPVKADPTKAETAQNPTTLSPTVYSPISPGKLKLPSPTGVGFAVPKASGAAANNPSRSPPRRRGTGDTESSAKVNAKGAWI
ncbi:uncharacterized protein C8A04DRAFT_9192 [Dichotomopilus funicola]|uniref:Uncharacterized protein n=1 Tax=Dichotomopilus funicola TaxID=1934379 RepID=A0AAN6V9Y7_9PEZI|nr:hypothetical protein C8A04DRAFT_9192 [Dichotomopilus funicola]